MISAEGFYSLNPDSVPPSVERLLRHYGYETISRLFVYREPVAAPIKAVVQVMSGKKFPPLFHVYQVIVTPNYMYRVDKNESVKVEVLESMPKGERIEVPLHDEVVSLEEYFENAEKSHPENFWFYDAQDANCQKFVLWCITANFSPVPEVVTNFFLQNIELPSRVKKVISGVTTTAAIVSRASDLLKSAFGKNAKKPQKPKPKIQKNTRTTKKRAVKRR